jgi:hypothetical protein
MAIDYTVQRTTGRCANTGRDLTPGEPYFAVLIETTDGFERLDYSIEGWAGPPEGAFCYWRSRIPVKDDKAKTVVVDTELLLTLFSQLDDLESNEEEESAEEREPPSEAKQQFRFVLGLLLMRKRLLKLDGTLVKDGREYWKLRLTRDQSIHHVWNPELTVERVEQLSFQLTALLSGDVDAAVSPPVESLDTSAASDDSDSDTVMDPAGSDETDTSASESEDDIAEQ